jgi:hypothetical protein
MERETEAEHIMRIAKAYITLGYSLLRIAGYLHRLSGELAAGRASSAEYVDAFTLFGEQAVVNAARAAFESP